MIDHGLPVGAVQVGALDHVVLGVRPVEPRRRVVDREAVGPEERRVGDDKTVEPVHRGALDPRLISPVGPKYCAENVLQLSKNM